MDNLITLPNGAIWDNNLPVNEQEQEAQNYVNEAISCKPTTETSEPAGFYPRLIIQEWEKSGLVITKITTYVHTAEHEENGLIASEAITVKESVWHEQTALRIFQKHQDTNDMIDAMPDIVEYFKQSGMTRYSTEKGNYWYVNFILEEHRQLLESFNAVITERN